jgi:hypothetical protein
MARLWDQKDDVGVCVRLNVVLRDVEEQKQPSPSMRLTLDLGLADAGCVASHGDVAWWRNMC